MNKKSILTYLIITLIIFLVGFFCGKSTSLHNVVISNLREISELKNFSISEYYKNKKISPPQLEIIISDSCQNILDSCRTNAIKAGILRDENKIEVPAKIVSDQDTFNIKMRLKGDYSDHWAGEKISYRIKVLGKKRLWSMKTFSIQAPETRRNINEWYFHKLLKHEGLIGLNYKFISLVEHGINKGTYALEENFDKQLLELNSRKEGPILKFDESILIDNSLINYKGTFSQTELYKIAKINCFKAKRTLKDSTLYSQYLKGKELLEKFRNREIQAHECFDIEKAAQLFAIADLTGGFHALRWKNIRFYYNPIINKLELIAFDSNSGILITDIFYNLWHNSNMQYNNILEWKNVFFESRFFIKTYFKYLKKYSQESFLQEFNLSIKNELELAQGYIQKDNLLYKFNENYYKENAKLIASKIPQFSNSREITMSKYFFSAQIISQVSTSSKTIEIKILNDFISPIRPIGIFDKHHKLIATTSLNSIHSGEKNIIQFNVKDSVTSKHLKIKRKDKKWVHKNIKLGLIENNSNDTLYVNIEHFKFLNKSITSQNVDDVFYNIDHIKKEVSIKEGYWSIKSDIIFDNNYKIICKGNTTLNLMNNSTFISNGSLDFKGTKKKPITICSTDTSGSVFISQSSDTSFISYVNFKNLSESTSNNSTLSGAVTFFESDVFLSNVSFLNNKSEDALNIVRSNFFIEDSRFENTKSDAFDGDFCNGTIKNLTFANIGNDALDFSGSKVSFSNISITNTQDKGISAGEGSVLEGEKVNISQTALGVVSKDSSILTINNITLQNIDVAIAVFNKKQEFGIAQMLLTQYKAADYKEEYLIEKGSIVEINKKQQEANKYNVLSILYGNTYGKSSK